MYKFVMGIDMGHGEVAVHYLTTNGIVPCTLDPDTKDKTLFSAIGYTGTTVKLGKAAINCDICYAYFKASPRDWNEVMPGGDGKKTKKLLMEDYLKQLMKQIRELNPELTELLKKCLGKPGEMLLLVGCPTSRDWLDDKNRKEYEKLISRATGCAREDVRVVPESRAAIFSVFSMNKEIAIDTTKGIAVFDFGSSTTDFTYLLMGKDRVEHSWTLGAARIEEFLTRLSLENANTNAEELSTNGLARLPMAVRSDKEAYFNDGFSKLSAQSIDKVKRVNGREERIEMGVNQFTGKPLYDHVTVNVPINDQTILFSLMGEDYYGASFDTKFCVRKDGKDDWDNASWYDHCRSFFFAMKQEMESKGLPCDTVVLTGGASKMAFIQNLWKEIFHGTKNMICEKVPAFSVSIGLCYLANAEAHLDEELNLRTPQLRLDIKNQIEKQTVKASKEIAAYAYKKAINVLEKLPDQKIRVTDLNDHFTAVLENDPDVKKMVEKYLVDDLKHHAMEAQKGFARKVMQLVFPGLEGMLDVNFDDKNYADMLKAIDINAGGLLESLDLTSILTKTAAFVVSLVVQIVITCVVYVVLNSIPIIGPFIAALAGQIIGDKVSAAIMRYGSIAVKPSTVLKEIKKKEAEVKEQIEGDVQQQIREVLQKPECMGDNYGSYVDKAEKGSCKLIRLLSMQEFR